MLKGYLVMSNDSIIFEGPPNGRSLPDWTGYLNKLLERAAEKPVDEELMDAISDAKDEIEFLKALESEHATA